MRTKMLNDITITMITGVQLLETANIKFNVNDCLKTGRIIYTLDVSKDIDKLALNVVYAVDEHKFMFFEVSENEVELIKIHDEIIADEYNYLTEYNFVNFLMELFIWRSELPSNIYYVSHAFDVDITKAKSFQNSIRYFVNYESVEFIKSRNKLNINGNYEHSYFDGLNYDYVHDFNLGDKVMITNDKIYHINSKPFVFGDLKQRIEFIFTHNKQKSYNGK